MKLKEKAVACKTKVTEMAKKHKEAIVSSLVVGGAVLAGGVMLYGRHIKKLSDGMGGDLTNLSDSEIIGHIFKDCFDECNRSSSKFACSITTPKDFDINSDTSGPKFRVEDLGKVGVNLMKNFAHHEDIVDAISPDDVITGIFIIGERQE